LRTEDYRKRLARKPERIIEDAVRRMLPKNKLATRMLNKLKVYAGDQHPHQAQKPKAVVLKSKSPAKPASKSKSSKEKSV